LQAPREQTIYIPYEKLRQTFEKDGRGVFIPYERFQELWKAARAQERKPAEVKPPTPAVITMADSEATVGKEVVRVVAQLKIDLLASGWVEVPLRLDDVGVISASLIAADGSEEPARLAVAADGGYKLVIENKMKGPRQIELRLEYAKAFNKTPGRNDVSFAAPQAPVNRWKVRIPETGAKIHIEPMIAATEPPEDDQTGNAPKGDAQKPPVQKPTEQKPAEQKPNAGKPNAEQKNAGLKANAKKQPEETVLLAFVGAAPAVRIDWTAKAEGASGLAALASVEAQQEVRIEEAALRTHARLTYSISRAELSVLTVEVPANQKVVNVAEANVRQWSVEKTGNAQKITVQLFEPARESESIDIDLAQYGDQPSPGAAAAPPKGADALPNGAVALPKGAENPAKAAAVAKPGETARRTLEVPVVKALNVSRQQGVVVVDTVEGLQIEARTRDGLLQLDAAELPPAFAKRPHELAYRYAGLPFQLSLDVVKTKPRIVVDEWVVAHLTPEQLTVQLHAVYTIERAGVFDLTVDVPTGYDVREVHAEACRGAKAVQVDSHHLEGADKTRLVVNLAHKALGCVSIVVELQKRLDDANLLSPTGKTSEIPFHLPRVAPESIERTNGRLVIYAPESLRINPGKQLGLRSVSLAEALAGVSATPANQPAAARPVSSFVYTNAPVELTLLAERRKPNVSVGQLLVAKVDPGLVKYDATFFYDIRYSGVKSLRIDVPTDLATVIRNKTQGITEKTLDPPPADLAKGSVAWSFTGEGELLGPVAIRLSWERPLQNLEVGKSVDLLMPHLRPEGADRAWGQIVLVKSETIDLLPLATASGLRPIDPQHDLMPGANVPDAAQAFEFQDDWSLTVAATRYQLEAVKHTSIERGLIRAVFTRGGQVAVQALYRMRSSGQQLAVELPSGAEFDTEPLRIDGRPTSLQSGAPGEFFVPLVGHGGDTRFLLDLRYTLPKTGIRVDLPVFRGEPAVQKVYVAAFLPEEQAVLGYNGPWTDEQQKYVHPLFGYDHSARNAEIGLVSWVREGVSVVDDPASSFPVDGQPYLYSTLRPESGDAGSLRLTTFNNSLLEFLVFAVVIAIGLALLRRPLAERGFVWALLVILLLLLGVFAPTFTLQILNDGLWFAIALTVLIWCCWFLLQRSQRQQRELVAANAGKTAPSNAAPSNAAPSNAAPSNAAPLNPMPQENVARPPKGGSPPNDASPDSDPPNEGEPNPEGGDHV
jgi:hypothetical protein